MPFSAAAGARTGAATAIPWAALVPLFVIAVCFDVYCFADMVRRPRVRRLPRWAWAGLTLVSVPLGGIAYLLFGRSQER